MLAADPQKQFEELKSKLLAQIQDTFPIRSRGDRYEVRVSNLSVKDELGVDDIKSQAKAKMQGRSWAAPVSGTLEIVDTKTGKLLVKKDKALITRIPKLTRHYSYIVGGQEKFVANQWRLRPGPYVKVTERAGEHEAQFQLAKGKSFDIQSDPTSGYMHIRMGNRKVPLYSVLSAYGVSDDQMKKAWGEENFKATRAKAKPDKDLRSLYRAWRNEDLPEGDDPVAAVRGLFGATKMDPVIAEANLGAAKEQVDGDVLLRASRKLIDVQAGKREPDPIDSLRYKELWTAADQFVDRVAKSNMEIERRVRSALGKKTIQSRLASGDPMVMRDVVMPDLIQRPVYHLFTTSLASNGKQTNPVSMLSDRSLVTITGPGGIQNRHSISKSNTAIDPSHLGFLDPVFTPESDPGVNTHLSAGVRIVDRKPYIRLFNKKTGKLEDVDAAKAAVSNVVLPDQVRWKGGRPVPVGKEVRMSDRGGRIRDDVSWDKAEYVLPSSAQVFATETNLVPFMQNDSAGRTTMSARHMAQAISIEGREAPQVQVEAGAGKTFEELVGGGFLSHRAPVSGVVKSVHKDDDGATTDVMIEDAEGKSHRVSLYNHYPTNELKNELHSEVKVKPGDKVKKGQSLGDNNYTKDGVLALGTNVRVAYLANGANHEDGIVISRSAADKLGSTHLYKPTIMTPSNMKTGKKAFLLAKPTLFTKERIANIGDDGVIKKGTLIEPGDPIVLALSEHTKAEAVGSLDARGRRRLGKRLRSKFDNASLVWDGEHPGEVVRVVRSGKNITVHVKTREPAQVGSKLSTRHSAKGIVTEIVDDEKMPVDKKGKPVQMLINPVSVPGRMNPGQILETAAGRIAEKTGKPYKVKNFDGGVDYLSKVKGELKKHGIKETEALYDPETGRKLGDITTGPHYVFQLEHQIDKKTHVRSGGMPSRLAAQTDAPKIHYDADTKVPRGGGHSGAQSLGALGIYGALAAGLKDNLREMQTLKSDQPQALEVWGALANGERLPAPEVPFVYKKFEAMLTAMGVNVRQEGAELRIVPRTDAETRKLSRGEIKKPNLTIRGKDDQPEKEGLFDRLKTGGPGGAHWSHIELSEPIPNPVYSKAIALTLGLDARFPDKSILKELQAKGRGPRHLHEQLKKIDLDKELKKTLEAMKDPKVRGSALDKLNFKYKALRSVKESGKHPADVWSMKAVPVLPPAFRPQGTLPDGTLKNNPLNELYKRVGMLNDSIRRSDKLKTPYGSNLDARAAMFEELQNLFGTTPKGKKVLDNDMRGWGNQEGRPLPGIVHLLSGEKPKDGFFQDKMIGKKQDYTARATIVADPNLSVDEIGVPKKVALELFRPMVSRRLMPVVRDPVKANMMISKEHPAAVKALEKELEDRPVLMKRDPVLHQYGLVGQRVRITESPAVKVSPLILPPIGGDVDGDTVALMVPLSREAVDEAKRIMPSQRQLHEASGDVLFTPSNESSLALYRMSLPRGNKRGLKFKDQAAAEAALKSNRIALNDVVTVAGVGQTTLGRMRIAKAVPEEYRKDILTNLKQPFTKKYQNRVLKETAKNKPKHFVEVADGLSRAGFRMAYESGHTVTLDDLEPLRKERGQLIRRTQSEVERLRRSGQGEKATEKWLQSTRELHDLYSKHYKGHPTNISDMREAGIKAKREQFQGLLMAPMLVEDHLGRPSKVPVTKSFAEGVDLGGYFLQASGARRGLIQKVDSVREPGYMSKMLVQANIDQPITGNDCGTSQGRLMSIGQRDVIDRHLAAPTKIGKDTIPAGTPITPEMLAAAKDSNVSKLMVRSPLKCRMPHGVCSKCMGVHPSGKHYETGEAVGIVAAQALGERAAQLMLKRTHGGGIVSTEGSDVESFGDVQRLFDAAKRGAVDARVAPANGTVQRVVQSRGQYFIYLAGRSTPIRSMRKPLKHVRPGAQVRKGETLTEGDANVHDLLKHRGLDAVQSEMADRIGKIYAKEGVLSRHAELAVRNATSVVRVDDPGDHDSYVRGDYLMKPVADEINKTVLKGKQPIKYDPMLTPTRMNPLRRQTDFIARLQGERLGQHLTTAIQHGQRSRLTGHHPIPGLAHGQTFGRPDPRARKG